MSKRHLALILVSCVLLVVVTAGLAAQPAQERAPVIVGFKDVPDVGLVKAHEGVVKYAYKLIPAVACSLSQGAIDALRANPRVVYVEVDGRVEALEETLPWGVDRIDAELVHPYNKGTGVRVAIVDSGIDYTHPDLDDNYRGGYDFVNNDADPMDDDGHGTHCAGIVAAEDNDIGVIGVAPEAYLYAVKVLDSGGSGYVSDVIAGIEWSVDNGMRVVSMSLGGDSDVESLHDACDAAYAAGIVLVAAAGNDGNPAGKGDNVDYPARYGSVIAVGATDENDQRAQWLGGQASSTGPDLELAAPGDNINSTLPGGGYGTKGGTSMSCPHVAGTAALVMVSYPRFNNSQVRERLQVTADDLGDPGKDTKYGYGLVDADEAAPETRQDVYLHLTVDPAQGTYSGGQMVTFEVGVFNEMGTALDSSLTLTVSGPGGYWYYDSQSVSVGVYFYAANVWVYTFGWSVPEGAVAGTYWVEVGLVPPRLTAYDAVWLEVV